MRKHNAFFLEYLPLEITLVCKKSVCLPEYLGSTLRGAIGQALICTDARAYEFLYNNRSLSGHQQDIVNPYVIVPPLRDGINPFLVDTLQFQLLLLGNAAQYTQPLVKALAELHQFGLGAERHPFFLYKVLHSIDRRVVWQDGRYYASAERNTVIPYQELSDVSRLFIHTHTPLRIRRNGALLEQIDFSVLIRSIVRRVQAITERYGGWLDLQQAENIHTLAYDIACSGMNMKLKNLKRYSNRRNCKMDLSGLTGSMCFTGALTPFVPWLSTAQILHIGRNTTFGMGRIEVEFM